jgi:hypothetical protein
MCKPNQTKPTLIEPPPQNHRIHSFVRTRYDLCFQTLETMAPPLLSPPSARRITGKKRTRRSEVAPPLVVVVVVAAVTAVAAAASAAAAFSVEAFAISCPTRTLATITTKDRTARHRTLYNNHQQHTALRVLGSSSSKAHGSGNGKDDAKKASKRQEQREGGGVAGGGGGGDDDDGTASSISSGSIDKLLPNLEDMPTLRDVVAATQSLAEPIQQVLDECTGGWALNYADLTPESPDTAIGRGFLLTNVFYLVAGLLLTYQGDPTLGFFTDLAAIASFNYHYTQLRATSQKEGIKDLVRLSLFLDYMAASISILTAVVYVVSASLQLEPDQLIMVEQSVAVGMVGLFFLVLSWKYEYGRPYIVFHSLWHLGSAVSGYLIGAAHLQALQQHVVGGPS